MLITGNLGAFVLFVGFVSPVLILSQNFAVFSKGCSICLFYHGLGFFRHPASVVLVNYNCFLRQVRIYSFFQIRQKKLKLVFAGSFFLKDSSNFRELVYCKKFCSVR